MKIMNTPKIKYYYVENIFLDHGLLGGISRTETPL